MNYKEERVNASSQEREMPIYGSKGLHFGRHKKRLELWEEHLKDQIVALDKPLKCVEDPYQGGLLASSLEVDLVFNGLWPRGAQEWCQRLWDKPLWESVWLYLDPWDSVRLRHSIHALECPTGVWTAR